VIQSGDFCREITALTDALLHLCQRKEKHLLKHAGITSVELRALQAVEEKRQTMRELAQHLRLSPSRVTRVVDSLSRKNLIKREDCPDDRRLCPVVLTPEGVECLKLGEEVLYRFQEQVTSCLAEEEKQEVVSMLRRFVKAMEKGMAGE